LDVQRAADALLRQGRKPSVAAIREHLGGGSPNTITPLLAKYWEKLGSRLGEGPESLERVPEALARVTELLWRRALEEARERLKLLQSPDQATNAAEQLLEQIGKLSIALAEARAREGEHLTHMAAMSKDREGLRLERASLMAMLKSTQALLEQQNARLAQVDALRARSRRGILRIHKLPRRHSPSGKRPKSSPRTKSASAGRARPRVKARRAK
jgi:chromosome segregation ATPase